MPVSLAVASKTSQLICYRGVEMVCLQILMYQVCKGVSFVHGREVQYRDLELHNLLMDKEDYSAEKN